MPGLGIECRAKRGTLFGNAHGHAHAHGYCAIRKNYMQKIFIIDASGYLYSCYFAIRNMTNSKGESTNALFGFIRSVLKLMKDFQPTHVVAVFDGPRNAHKRTMMYPEYKAHRSSAPPDLPYQIAWAHEFCALLGIPHLNIPEVEADDTMGTLAAWATGRGATAYLCTSDKDMSQVVTDQVLLLNTRKDNLVTGPKEVEEIYGVPPSQMVDLLAMTGDTSDNVPGIPGIGPKTAASLLKQFGSLDNLLAHPEQAGAKKAAVISENADKARISRKLVTLDLHVSIPKDEEFYSLKQPELNELRAFYSKMNFNSLLKDLDTAQAAAAPVETSIEPLPHGPYLLVDTEKELHDLIKHLHKQKEICLLAKGTEDQPIKSELVGIGLGIRDPSLPPDQQPIWYVPMNGELGIDKVLHAFKPLFEDQAVGFYGHNIKCDYQILANYGIHIANICFDTTLASYLLNSHNRQHSLETLALQYFGKTRAPISELIGKGKSIISMFQVPIQKVCDYTCEGVNMALRLKSILETELGQRNLEKVFYEIELPLIKVLAKMERHGIYVDVPYLEKVSITVQSRLKHLEQEIYRLAGHEFNINSPKQLSDILQNKLNIPLPKKTATGFSTSADILDALKEDYPIAQVLLDYRQLEKLRSTYLDNLAKEVYPKTHRIHCTFNQTVAATGRLSCQEPNLQNIPVRTDEGRKIREAFRPSRPDWSYLSADYSQVELRLLAHFSGDPSLITAFKHNEDIHASTAAAVLGISLDQVTPLQRFQAKAVNFGIIYGQQAFGLSQELKIDVRTAGHFIDAYFARYNKVKEYLESSKERARQAGRAVTLTGRERLIPEITSRNGQLRQLAERLAVNTPLQGTAADMIKLAMLRVDKALSQTSLKGYMILQVHDELIFEIPDNEIEQFKPIVLDAMQNVFQLKVPLVVDIKLGKNWKEC